MRNRHLFVLSLLMVVSLSSAKTTEKIYSSSQGSVRVQVCNSRMVRITKSMLRNVVPGALRYYDLPDLLRLSEGRVRITD